MDIIKKVKDIYKNIPIQAKASGWFFVCSFLQKAIAVISTMIFTRLISSDDYGIISIFNTWSDVLYILATLNLSTGVYNVGMTKFSSERKEFNSSLQLLALFWNIGFSIVFLIIYRYIAKIIQLPFSMIILIFVTFCFLPAFNLWSAKQRYENKYKELVIVSISYAFVILMISLIAILNFNNKSIAKIVSNSVVTILFGAILFINNLNFQGKKIRKDFIVFALKFNLPMIPAFLSMVILNQIDRIMISSQVSLSKAGIYSVAYSSAMFISILSTAINATYNPWLMQKIHVKKYDKVSDVTKIISLFFVGVIIFFIILAPEFIRVMASSEYYEAIYVVPPVAASTFFTLIYTYYCPFAQYYLKMKFLVFINIGVAVINIILNYLGISIFGYFAAGYTTYIGFLIYGWGTILYTKSIMRKEIGSITIYDERFFFILTMLLTIAMIIINFLYRTYLLRYVILFALLILAWVQRNKMYSIINDMRGKNE